jgi:hypothetical protein
MEMQHGDYAAELGELIERWLESLICELESGNPRTEDVFLTIDAAIKSRWSLN